MPIYQYKCLLCDLNFESLRKIADMDLGVICPQCDSKSIQRIFPTSFAPLLNHREKSNQSEKRVPSAILNDIRIENCGTGIKAEGGYIKGENVKMRNCDTGIDSVNSEIEIDHLDIT